MCFAMLYFVLHESELKLIRMICTPDWLQCLLLFTFSTTKKLVEINPFIIDPQSSEDENNRKSMSLCECYPTYTM